MGNYEKQLKVNDQNYKFYSLNLAFNQFLGDLSKLPVSLKILLENLLRHEDGKVVSKDDLNSFSLWLKNRNEKREVAFYPSRVLMQDFTGVPAVVDLAVMRESVKKLGGDLKKINPLTPVDLVIDHSVNVDHFGTPSAFEENMKLEMSRNSERYQFLKWGQTVFNNFRVVPPGTGICHQVNLEYLGKVVQIKDGVVFPDTLVGTDSHTTMVNGLSILGWGVGGIEAEAAMLGQPLVMLLPEVIGVRLSGKLNDGVTATDLVLTITQLLRKKGVVDKFVEFFGSGLSELSLADRATISNMAPEYGATCGFFPVDQETLNYLRFTGRPNDHIALVEAYAKEQGLWRSSIDPLFTDVLEVDLEQIEPSVAGPKRPQDRVPLSTASFEFQISLGEMVGASALVEQRKAYDHQSGTNVKGTSYNLNHGDIVLAAITSCTNTSNPSVLMAAGLLAQKAVKKGLKVKPWVKTSLAPGSQVVTDYLKKSGLSTFLDQLGFHLVGYGCTTCIGNSGPLAQNITEAIHDGKLLVCSVLSGNRNFEGRIHPHVKANYLASPPLVVAYALTGSMKVDLTKDPLGFDPEENPIYLRDIWPSQKEISDLLQKTLTTEMFTSRYKDVFKGPQAWQKISIIEGDTYKWDLKSTYIQSPPYFDKMTKTPEGFKEIKGAKCLALLGDSVTTDHISPAGSFKSDSPAGKYLMEQGVSVEDFNSYGARRGNHEVMMRGTFANIRLKNEMVSGVEGGYSRYMDQAQYESIFDVSKKYQNQGTPLIIIAGKEYGTGSSRDWAAKGPKLLGIRAVIAESFERIHRSNLIGMGILPIHFSVGVTRKTLGLTGNETFDIITQGSLAPHKEMILKIIRKDGTQSEVSISAAVMTQTEVEYLHHGGILQFVIRQMIR